MDGLQLAHLLSMNSETSKYFQGIAMRDSKELPGLRTDPSLYILNTDSKYGKGEHWCVAVYEGGVLEFFDSFGMHPIMYSFQNLLTLKHFDQLVYNQYCFQHFQSHVCGHHCFFFAYQRSRGMSLSQIQCLYNTNDKEENDQMVLNFVVKYGEHYYPR